MTAPAATTAAPPRSENEHRRRPPHRPPAPEDLSPEQAVRELRKGRRLDRVLFHRIYDRVTRNFKAELIGGVVHVASPVTFFHGKLHLKLGVVLSEYQDHTPGTEVAGDATVILGDDSEPQPDLHLRIRSDHGGQASTADTERGEAVPRGEAGKFVLGPPELVLEVAYSTRDSDLNAKRADYTTNGVQEYIVASFADQRFYWYDLAADEELTVPEDGILRSRQFPGLWLDQSAANRRDGNALRATLARGLATPGHAAFVERLAAAKAEQSADSPGGG